MKTKRTQKVLTINPANYAAQEVHVGPDSRGPSKCLCCMQAFQPGEVWQRLKSFPDPELGSYFVGVHTNCPVDRFQGNG